jgi:flagellar basal-body rod protein FlgB
MVGWLDFKILNQLEKALDATNLRNKILADNIANIDTPGFKRSDINFQAVLKEVMADHQGLALKRTSDRHLSGNRFWMILKIKKTASFLVLIVFGKVSMWWGKP